MAHTISPPPWCYWQLACGIAEASSELSQVLKYHTALQKGNLSSVLLFYCQRWQWLKSWNSPPSILLGLANDLGNESSPHMVSYTCRCKQSAVALRHVLSIYLAFPCLYEAVFNLTASELFLHNQQKITDCPFDFPFSASVYHLKAC